MNSKRITTCIFLLVCSLHLAAQQFILQGQVRNSKLEPLSFVTVQIKGLQIGTKTDENGHYEFQLEEGEYELIFSLIGYKRQIIKFIHGKNGLAQNVILEENNSQINEVKIVSFKKDKAEELIRKVIQKKNDIRSSFNSYSAEIYIRATEENEKLLSARKLAQLTDSAKAVLASKLPEMNMTEVYLQVDFEYPNKLKEKRTGIKIRGEQTGLFFLSTTEGDFSLYNNLIKVPSLSETPMLSPISYSGLIAYKYRTKHIIKKANYTIYTIHFSPSKLGNALIEGDVTIIDTSWTILSTSYTFPKYHMPEYDYFEIKQDDEFVDQKAWLPIRQEFLYRSKNNKTKTSGKTIAVYDHYKIDTQFSKKHFSKEISSTTIEAYKKDSSFWNTVRKEPLNEKEVKFIIKNDSIYRATHAKHYLDSIDEKFNKITIPRLLFFGQSHYNRKKERTYTFEPLISTYRPFYPGGARVELGASYLKLFESKKSIFIDAQLSYGFLNRDFMGSLMVNHRYNPFSNGYITANIGRDFDFIFLGDAYINLFRRSNFYIKNSFDVEHGLEIANGLILRNKIEFAERQSLEQLKLSRKFDTLFTYNNEPIKFASYNSLYASITLEYTPFSAFIREPREKIVLGSKYPTAYINWRKGIPNVMKSEIDFDYLELGIRQKLKLGLAGISQYKIFAGEFVTQKDLRYIDYKFISRRNPGLFNNPLLSFQSLDTTFNVFKRFYEAHYLHHFNGAILNKIPFLKKLNLLEVAGASFLLVPERKLRYAEAYVGIEKIVPLFLEKFKFGIYFVNSFANKYNTPIQLKFGFDIFDRRKNNWD